MTTVQIQHPGGHFELYEAETGEFIERSDRKYEDVPFIGYWDPTKAENSRTVIEHMSEELEEIKAAMERLEQIGFSLELMEIYIYKKTSVNLRDIRKVLSCQREFLDEAFKPTNER